MPAPLLCHALLHHVGVPLWFSTTLTVYRILILPLIGLTLIPASRPPAPPPTHTSTLLVVDIDEDISVSLTNFRFALLIWML